MKTKLFTLFVALICVAQVFAHDFEVGGIYYNKLGGDSVEVTYQGDYRNSYDNEYTGSVTIPETVSYNSTTHRITAIGNSALRDCSGLTSVTIPESVTMIGDYAFSGCDGLTEVTIPESVTSIGNYVFRGCSSLTEVTIPEGVTSIGEYAFWGCSSLTEVTIPESVTSIGNYVFRGCSSLTEVTIPEGVTSIGEYAFWGCSSLTEVTIPNSVTSIGNDAFYGCSKLTEITIPEGVISIGSYAFSDCSSLTEVTIPNSVTSIGYAVFHGCSSLTEVTIPESVTSIGNYVFYGCSSLTEVTIPEGVTSIGEYAFWGCSSLTEVTIPNSVTSIGNYAFYGCSSLTEVTIPNSVTSIGYDAFYGCSSLTKVTWNAKNCTDFSSASYAPFYDIASQITFFSFGDNVERIPAYLCYDMSKLTEVTIPNSVTSIGNDAFYRCSSLSSVIWNAKNCTDFSGAFSDSFHGIASQITSFTFGNEVEHIPAYLCVGMRITAITIPESVTSIGDYAFSDCSSLTQTNYTGDLASWCKIDFGSYYSNPISYSHNLYINGQSITKADIPNSVTSIGESAFWGCSSLTEVTIPNSVTSIGNYAFYGCSSLTEVTWNAKNCTDFSSASSDPFYDIVSQITSFTFGDNVERIPAYLCYNMSKLTSITIPESVTSIGGYAFYGCSSLTEVTWNAKNCTDFRGAFSDSFYDIVSQITSFTFGNEVEHIPAYLCVDMRITAITIPESVTSIGDYAFDGCSYRLETITVAATNENYSSEGNCLIEKATNTLILGCKNSIIPESVTSIGNSAFYGCSKLTEITIPEGVTSIGGSAFYGCSKLTEITIPEGVTSIGNSAFYGCSKLTEITIPEGVTSIGRYAFSYCSSLTEVTIPEGVTSIGDDAFSYCSSLTEITIPEGVTSIGGYAFRDCSSLTEVTWNAKNCTDFSRASYAPFYDIASQITSFSFGDNVERIPAYLCYDMSKLTEITIPESVTSIGDDTFYSCSKLTSVIIPNKVTTIGNNAFKDCSSLTSITIPSNTTSIGSSAFANCSSIAYITSKSTTPPTTASDAFSGVPTGAEVTVPCNSAPNYRVATGWTGFQYVNEDFVYEFNVTTSDESKGLVQTIQFPSCGVSAIVKALPMDGYKFQSWSDGNTNSMRQITVNKDINLLAYFVALDGSDNEDIEGNVTTTPADNSVSFTWPVVDHAVTYVFTIYADANQTKEICTLTCNALGQLMNISFPRQKPAANQAVGTLLNFTIDGLDAGTTYSYTLNSYDEEDTLLIAYSGMFTTTGNPSTGLDDIRDSMPETRKVFENGTIYIIRPNGEKYTVDGRKVE